MLKIYHLKKVVTKKGFSCVLKYLCIRNCSNSTEKKKNNSNIEDENIINHSRTNLNPDKSEIHSNLDHDHLFPKSVKSTAESIGSATIQYTTEINKVYHDLEQKLMMRINESNTQRFRILLITILLAIVWIGSMFGSRIRARVAKETAGLAKETLENESLKVQTQELAMAVAQTILNDKEITSHAALFLREAAAVPETQEALLKLTIHILQHPDTLEQTTHLFGNIVKDLSNRQVV
jgi:hypothetical protein